MSEKKPEQVYEIVPCQVCRTPFSENVMYKFEFDDPFTHEHHEYRMCYEHGEPIANIMRLMTL